MHSYILFSFAFAYIIYTLLGALFFEKVAKTLNKDLMYRTFNTPHDSRVSTRPFTVHKEIEYPHFFYFDTFKVKNQLYFTNNAYQIIQFPIQPILHNPLKTYFRQLHNHILFLGLTVLLIILQVYQNIKELFRNKSKHYSPFACSLTRIYWLY